MATRISETIYQNGAHAVRNFSTDTTRPEEARTICNRSLAEESGSMQISENKTDLKK